MHRELHATKSEISKQRLEWILETCLPNYDYQCGDYLYPDNDVNRVVFPDDNWKDDRRLIEFRHSINCATPLEVQVSHVHCNFTLVSNTSID